MSNVALIFAKKEKTKKAGFVTQASHLRKPSFLLKKFLPLFYYFLQLQRQTRLQFQFYIQPQLLIPIHPSLNVKRTGIISALVMANAALRIVRWKEIGNMECAHQVSIMIFWRQFCFSGCNIFNDFRSLVASIPPQSQTHDAKRTGLTNALVIINAVLVIAKKKEIGNLVSANQVKMFKCR